MRRLRRLREQRGATAVVVAIMLTVLVGFLGLVMNVGHSRMVRGQLQNACDAAALAGSQSLDGTAAGVAAARAMAADYAARHVTDANVVVGIDPNADVEVGNWDFTLPRETAFTPLAGGTTAELMIMNAVRVKAGRETSRGNALSVWLGAALNGSTMNVEAEAVAVGGGPRNNKCPVPIVLPSCALLGNDGKYMCGQTVNFTTDGKFSNANVDTIGFTNLASNNSVSNSGVRDILNNGTCLPVTEGQSIGVGNGNAYNKQVYDALAHFLQVNGNTVAVPVVDIGGCPNPQFVQMHPIAGFATVTLTMLPYDNQNKVILIQGALDCTDDADALAGGGFFGMSPKTGLVR